MWTNEQETGEGSQTKLKKVTWSDKVLKVISEEPEGTEYCIYCTQETKRNEDCCDKARAPIGTIRDGT